MSNDRKNSTKQRKDQNAKRKETYKYLGILEADTIKQVEIRTKLKKFFSGEQGIETKLRNRNLINAINTWTVLLVRYLGPFLKWTREEL